MKGVKRKVGAKLERGFLKFQKKWEVKVKMLGKWEIGTRVRLIKRAQTLGVRGIFSAQSKYTVPKGAIGRVIGHLEGAKKTGFYWHEVRFRWRDPKNKQIHSGVLYLSPKAEIVKV